MMKKSWNPEAQLQALRFSAIFSLVSVVYFLYYAMSNVVAVWLPEMTFLNLRGVDNIPLIWAAVSSALALTYYLKIRKLGGGRGVKEFFGMFKDEFARAIYQKAAARMANVLLLITLMLFVVSVLFAQLAQWAAFLNGVTVTSIALSLALFVFGTTVLSELTEDDSATCEAN